MSAAAEIQALIEAMEDSVVVMLRGESCCRGRARFVLKPGSVSEVLRSSEVISLRSCRGLDFGLDFGLDLKSALMSELLGNIGIISVRFCRGVNLGYPRGLKGR